MDADKQLITRWNHCHDVAMRLLADDFKVFREGMAALKEIKTDELYKVAGYETFEDCTLRAFGLTSRMLPKFTAAIRSVDALPDDLRPGRSSSPRTANEMLSAQEPFRRIGKSLADVANAIEELATTDIGASIQAREIKSHMHNASAALKDAMPAGECGYCKPPDPCEKCGGRRVLPYAAYKHMPPELRRDGQRDE